jgi:hypothetical protein
VPAAVAEVTPMTEGNRGRGAVRRTGRIEYEWAMGHGCL